MRWMCRTALVCLSSWRRRARSLALVLWVPCTSACASACQNGACECAQVLLDAKRRNRDIGSIALLNRYERQQRLATWPLYQATNLLVDCYTNDRLPMRLLRGAALRAAQQLRPLKRGIARHLTAGA